MASFSRLWLLLLDTTNNEMFRHDEDYYCYSDDSPFRLETDTFTYYLSGQYAVKAIRNFKGESETSRDISSSSMDVGAIYREMFEEVVTSLDEEKYITYYGNDNPYDLHVAIDGENGLFFDATFVNGLLIN